MDGEGLVLVRGIDSVTAMATDGYYIPIEKYAEAMDVPLVTVKTWKKRKTIEAITLFGRSYVKRGCEPDSHSYKKYCNVKPCSVDTIKGIDAKHTVIDEVRSWDI